MMTRGKRWRLGLGLLFGSFVLALALIYWMVPIPTLILNKISGQIASHLPEGWSLENWQVSRSYLRQLRKGELPQLDFELTDGQWRVYVTLEPRWNASISSPLIQSGFQIKAKSSEIQISPLAGQANIEFAKQFKRVLSLDFRWDNQDLQVEPYGTATNFSGVVKKTLETPEVTFSLANLSLTQAEAPLNLQGLVAEIKLDLALPLPYLVSGDIKFKDLQAVKGPSSGKVSQVALHLEPENVFDLKLGGLEGLHKLTEKTWALNSTDIRLRGKIEQKESWTLSQGRLALPTVSLKSADDQEISLEQINVRADGDLDDFKLKIFVGAGGAILGETFMGFPENGVTINLKQKGKATEASIRGLIDEASGSLNCSNSCNAKWSLASNFGDDVKTYASIYPDAPPPSLSPGGSWKLTGSVPFDAAYQPRLEQLEARVQLKDVSLTNEARTWALQGIAGNFPVQGIGETHASLKIGNIQYKNLKTSLNFPDWKLYFHLGKKEFRYWLPATSFGGDMKPVEIGAQELYWKSPNSLQFASSLFAVSKNINPLLEKACIAKADSIPEISWSARYPAIKATSKKLTTPEGAMSARVFTGTAKVTRFTIKDWFGAIPETNFDFDIKNFNLEPLGQWLNFGRMIGLFEAYAHDVVFKAKIPTGFLSRVELLPVPKRREIIFSSRAMKNFTQLFTSQDVTQQIPGIVRWFSFGWPSDLIGGFNIKYAGISLFSNDGSILLETLDPKWVLQKEGRHYLLYGNRFKIPINAVSYPVVLDAPGMSQFVSHMYYQLLDLQDEETPNDGEKNETEDWCKYSLDGSAP